ncbi:unnamed protein product, partial [Staurois parvus]
VRVSSQPVASQSRCRGCGPHRVTPTARGDTGPPLHKKVSCKESRQSPQDGLDLRIEHNGSESDPLCSICRSDPFYGDRRRGCHQVLPHWLTQTL